MPQINKIVRGKDIKQVSRTDDLKPATEKTITKAVPLVQVKQQIDIEQKESLWFQVTRGILPISKSPVPAGG